MVRLTHLLVLILGLAVLAGGTTAKAGAPSRTDGQSKAVEAVCTATDGVETVCITTRGYIRVEGSYTPDGRGR